MDAIKATTRDVGLAIRDYLKTSPFVIFEEIDGELKETQQDRAVDHVDASDPNNLLFVLDNGQRFRVRISAEG